MFSKSSLGIQRGHDDRITTRIEGSREEVLVLLATLNAQVIKQIIDEPKEYSDISLAIQQNTLKAYAGLLMEDVEKK